MIELMNCITELASKIQAQEKMDKAPIIMGFRLIDGPWDNTKFLDIETKDKTYSGLLVETGCNLNMVSPFKVTKKDVKK